MYISVTYFVLRIRNLKCQSRLYKTNWNTFCLNMGGFYVYTAFNLLSLMKFGHL